ncbi:LCP family protein [Labedella endophytica]|uniref:LytR family transcriptional regulator n=1 Tax=Labedella endophytica TaxID=1523160 RepID=A0A433JV42_9MICO|nr:LCP family protein [Labedella endophytica]RUR02047.1 LytR family transcriptional regulator [Labedella endophytica]
MTHRAWWLVLLNFLIPGSAQVLAGNRRLGRIGLGATLSLWALAVVGLALFVFLRSAFITIVTFDIVLWIVQGLMLAYAVLWLVLTMDTFRLVRLVKAAPGARVWIAAATVVLLAVSTGGATVGAYYAGVTRGTLSSIFGGGAVEPPVDGRYNILLLGGDAGPDRDGLRPDTIRVMSIDAETGAATTIGLPRDMRHTPFSADSPMAALYPDGFQSCDVSACKLNSIYTEAELRHQDLYPDAVAEGSTAGIEAMKEAAEGVTGLTIQYYVLIDMEGFANLIDALGGVEVTVEERLPIGGDENLDNVDGWIEPGTQILDGYHAQWYARSRHSTSDWDRMARQNTLIEAIVTQFTPGNVLTKFEAIADAGAKIVKTDIPQGMLSYFVDLATKTREQPIESVELTPPTVDPDDPDFAAIRELIAADLAPEADGTTDGG